MPVTLRYVDGTAAVFSSVEEALAQAVHDYSQPGHTNPLEVLEGDHGEVHARWGERPDDVVVVHSAEDLADRQCDCVECEFQRRAPEFGLDGGAQRSELLTRLQHEREGGERP